MAPPLHLSPGYRSVFTSKRVLMQWRKSQLLDTSRRSLFLISSIAFPLAIQSVRGWVLSLCKQFQDSISGRNTKPCTSSQYNGRISLLKRYEDTSNNCGLCLLQMNEFSRRRPLQLQDRWYCWRAYRTIPLPARVSCWRILHSTGIRWQRIQQGVGHAVENSVQNLPHPWRPDSFKTSLLTKMSVR